MDRPSSPHPAEKAIARVFVGCMALYLVIHCWVTSAAKPLWMDELLSFTLVTDPSLPHALSALAHGCDGGFPSHYCVAWLAAHLFGPGELPLRLVSTAFMAAAFGLAFGLLRRTYGLSPAMLAVTLGIGGSTLILYMNSELRFYADLFFSATLAVGGYDLLFRRAPAADGWPPRALAMSAAGHACLVLCHPFGIVYSAAISGAAVLTFWWVRPRRFLGPYLASAATGDAFFLLWVRGFLEQTHLVAGRGALPVPAAADFLRIYAQLAPAFFYDDRTKAWAANHFLPIRQHLAVLGLAGALGLAGIVVAVIAWRYLFSATPGSGGEPAPAEDRHLLVLAVVFVLVPAGFWVFSHLGKSLFLHRYFIPSVLGFVILYARGFAALYARAAARGTWQTPGGKAALGAAALLFGAVYVAWPLASAWTMPDGHSAVRARAIQTARGVPVICKITNTFWQSRHYASDVSCWFILDRDVAYNPRNGLAAVAEFNLMGVLGQYYPALHIQAYDKFFRRNPEFIVDETETNLWYDTRLGDDPNYRVKEATGLPPDARWLVRTSVP